MRGAVRCRELSGVKHKLRYGGDYGFGRELRIQEEITEWEGITHVGKNYKVGRNSKWEEIPESGEMHEWEEITEPAKVQEWERFPSAGKLQSAAKLQFPGEFAKVRKTTKSSWWKTT